MTNFNITIMYPNRCWRVSFPGFIHNIFPHPRKSAAVLLTICSFMFSFSFVGRAQTYGANNTGISSLTGPVLFCSGNHDVKVKLENFGTNIVNLVTVKWTLDGVPQTPILWTNSIDTIGGVNPSDTVITLGNVLFNTPKVLKAWAEYPNNLQDTVNSNDTLTVTIAPALNGNYAIDMSGSGPNNYPSFSAAAAALSANGVCGPVYLSVAPGIYTEQPVFSQIPGVSSTNTITIDGVDTATRKLTFAGSATMYPTLTISGVPYFTVKNLAINATTQTGFGVLINGASDYTRISKCRINTWKPSDAQTNIGIVVGGNNTNYANGGVTNHLIIDSNVISGGTYGIAFYHNSPAENNSILHNSVSDYTRYGIYSYNNQGILVSGNTVSRNRADASYWFQGGIVCLLTSNSALRVPEISNNRVNDVGVLALQITGTNAPGNKGRIINNVLKGGPLSLIPNNFCRLTGSNWSFAHNTLYMDEVVTNNTYGGLFIDGSSTGISVVNNILSSGGVGSTGRPFYAVSATSLDSMDYNTFYRQDTSDGNLIYIGAAFNSGNFKGGAGFNGNSTFENPDFDHNAYPTIRNSCMKGVALAYVPTDVNGTTRAFPPTRGALEYARVNVDAHLKTLISPAGPMASGLHDLTVQIINAGTIPLTSLQVSYTENNGAPKTVSWSGSLAPCDTASVVFNGGNQINITSVHNMVFYTSMPNGVPDQHTANDSLTAVFRPALSGNYTIGSAGASYPDFISAAADLKLRGVAGPVTFTVNPGTYTGQVVLDAIMGASAANPITFNGVDAATRIIEYTPISNAFAESSTLTIYQTQSVTFRNFSIKIKSGNFGRAVWINGKSDGTRITNCIITVPEPPTTATGIVGVYLGVADGARVDHITLDSNLITGGYQGIACYGLPSNYSAGLKVLHNTVQNTTAFGIYMYCHRAVTIVGNLVNGKKHATGIGIRCFQTGNNGSDICRIQDNRIMYIKNYALDVVGSHASGNKGIISNNMLGGGMSGADQPVCNLDGSNWSFAHNTLHRDFPTNTARFGGLYVTTASQQVSISNNIFSSTSSGSAGLPLYVENSTSLDTLDYNLYYRQDTSNSQLIYVGGALNVSGFKGASGYNLNSQFLSPEFINDTFLTPNLCSPLAGPALSYVTSDIYGTPRNATTPTVGAAEYIKYAEDLSVEAVAYPNAPLTAGYQDIGVRVKNLGTSTITSFNLTYTNNNDLPVTISWYGSLGACDTVTVVFNGFYQLNINGFHRMKFYTSQPNFVADGNPTNDTLETIFLLPLNGTYTVGGATADFATPTDAVYALQLAGISGPVTFNFTPNMPAFNAGFELGNITGVSAANTITFNGNGDTLVGKLHEYIIALNGASYVTFNGFYMKARDFASPGMGICMRNNTHHVTIKNNTIDLGMISGVNNTTATIAATGSITSPTTAGANATYLTIDSNTLVGGYYNLSLIGNSSYLDNYGHQVRGNVCRDFYAYGIYVTNGDSIRISGNDIHRMNRSLVTTFYGISLSTARNIKVINNAIHDAMAGTGTFANYSMHVNTSVNSAGYETEFINNITYNPSTTGTIYAYYLQGTRNYMKFYHNTVDLDLNSSTGTVRGIFMSTAPNNHDFKNNIVSVRGTGTGTKHLIYASVASASITSDYNVLYMGATGGSNYVGYIGANQTTLANWQTASAVDANSRGFNPVFSNAVIGDLTPLSLNIDNMGTNVGVTTDITGAPRSAITPDAGAFEFTGISGDLRLKSASLKRSSPCYNTNDTVFAVVENLIGNAVDFSIDPLTFVWNNAGPVNSNGTITINSGTLAPGVTDTFYATNVNMSMPGDYTLNAYIQSNAVNIITGNDTLGSPVLFNVMPILSVSPKTAFVNSPTDSVILQATTPLFTVTPGASLAGFNWNYNGSSIATTPRTVVGPYTTPGTYTYIASYTNACGTFYDTVIVTAGAGVPVKLLSFEAKATDADVQVTWKTASEKNTARFEVFRSTDHKNWEPVETVKAAGNSNMTRSYRITDRNAMSLNAPVIYYKLKSVDRDGSFEWSHEASVNTTVQPGSISVYPNPFTDNLTVRVASEGAVQVEITSLQGKHFVNRSLTSDNGTISLDHLGLEAGIYFIRVTQNGTTSVQKLIKQ